MPLNRIIISLIIGLVLSMLSSCIDSHREKIKPHKGKIKILSIYIQQQPTKVLSEKKHYDLSGQLILHSFYHYPESETSMEEPLHTQFAYAGKRLVKEVHSIRLLNVKQLNDQTEINDVVYLIVTYNEHGDTSSLLDLCRSSRYTYVYGSTGLKTKTEESTLLCATTYEPQNVTRTTRYEAGKIISVTCPELGIDNSFRYEYSGGNLKNIYRNNYLFEHFQYNQSGQCVNACTNLESALQRETTTRKYNSQGMLAEECTEIPLRDMMFQGLHNCRRIEYDNGDTLKVTLFGSGIHTRQRIEGNKVGSNDIVLIYKYTYY